MDFFSQITAETIILTPNRRLSAYYLNAYNQYQVNKKNLTWKTLDILPLSSWLERTWKLFSDSHFLEKKILLTPPQERIIWEKIISLSPRRENLLQISETAELAMTAWEILKQWQVKLEPNVFSDSEDHLAFFEWANAFRQHCDENAWLDSNNLACVIEEKIIQNEITVPIHILMLGFSELSPLISSLFAVCEKKGTRIDYHQQHRKNNITKKISLADEKTEITTMALWAKTLIQTTTLPLSIACIVPQLEDKREEVNRIFSEIFGGEEFFNISAGKSLANYPIIHTALELLHLANDGVSLSVLSDLLCSPFIGDAEKEMLPRANFINQLRNDNISEATLHELTQRRDIPPELKKQLIHVLSALDHSAKNQSIDYFIDFYLKLLSQWGWPGERVVNSEEFQLIQRWMNLLTEFKSFEIIINKTTYKTTLQYLKRLTAQTVFQPESPQTPIQILGPLEAAELPFDYAWIMGMDDVTWPPIAKPNPFIPQTLQKTLHMPHATPERELDFCEKITTQLKNGADFIVFSHALHEEESEMRPSPLLESLPEITFNELKLINPISSAALIFEHKKMETIQDTRGPCITGKENIKGGTKIIELQASCAFRAFAEMRLHARPIEFPTCGLRAYDRGNVIHKILELFWKKVKTSDTLNNLMEKELNNIIEDCMSEALRLTLKNYDLNSRYLQLERHRMKKILLNWLEIEKSRPPFSVSKQEYEHNMTLGNLEITLRIDRIDTLESNQQFIIDYKTGKNYSVKQWFDERPDTPQLPLYSLIDPTHIAGIAFGIIHPENMTVKGISRYDLNIQSVETLTNSKATLETDWGNQLETWKNTFHQIANDFYQGQADVNPKNDFQTCEPCQLKSLCRIYEKSMGASDIV